MSEPYIESGSADYYRTFARASRPPFAFERGSAVVSAATDRLAATCGFCGTRDEHTAECIEFWNADYPPLVQDEYTNLPCDCGRGPILEGNGTPDVCAACYDEMLADLDARNDAE